MYSLKKLGAERYMVWNLLRETDPFYLNHHLFDLDFFAIEADRQKCRDRGEDPPSYVAYALAAYSRTLAAFATLNSYLRRWPRTRLAVFDQVDVALTIERELHGRRIVLLSLLTDAGNRPVADIHDFLQHRRLAPLDTLHEYARYRRMLAAPMWLRTLVLRTFYKPNPDRMRRLFGTTAFTSIGRLGTALTIPLSPSTCTMSLGRVEPRPRMVSGGIEVRPSAWVTLTYDHRVLDGADVARAGDYLRQLVDQWCEDPARDIALSKR